MSPRDTFRCPRCDKEHETLEARCEGDGALLALYQRKLPRRGWAGKLDCTEREYVMRASAWRRALAERGREAPFAGQRAGESVDPVSQAAGAR